MMVGLAVLIGEIIVYKTIFPFKSVLGFITGFSITGASMASNDYWDRGVDKVNSPERPIPSGRVTPKEAAVFAAIISVMGLISAYFINFPTSVIIASVGLLMFLSYNYRVKQLGFMGNILVSASIVLPLVFGSLVQPESSTSARSLTLLVFFELMIFFSNTGREVNKGISDIEGDKVRKVSTIALKYGTKAAAQLSSAFYLFAVSLSSLPWFLGLVSWFYVPLVAVVDLGFVASVFILLKDYSKENALKVKRIVLVWMLLGLLAFVVGALQ
jgi:geranylgeranylglycerol-phosphate geranylgeranyltransferase